MKLAKALITIVSVFAVLFQLAAGNVVNALVLGALSAAVLSGINSPELKFSGHLCANTLTNLIPDFYAALDVVSRELTGFIPAVQRDPRADRCALNATMRSIVAPANAAAGNVTPAMSLPSAADQTIGSKTFTIQKSRFAPFSWTGEEQGNVEGGPGYLTIKQDQIAQAIRALVNEMEVDCATYGYLGSSRAFGTTAGTAPILSDFANIKKVLDDNGAPMSDRHIVGDTTMGAALRNISNLFKVNESGDSNLLRQGILGNLYGFDIRESAQVQTPTKGTGASATTNNAGYAVGATTLTLAAAGTGTILAGDVVTFAGDTNKYVVATGNADVSAGGTIVLAAPGLRVAMSAATKAITVFGTSARNLAFTRNAILLGTRLPALPMEGDIATDREIVVDDRTGLAFEVAVYPGYRMVTYHVSIAWGVAVMKPEHLATIIG